MPHEILFWKKEYDYSVKKWSISNTLHIHSRLDSYHKKVNNGQEIYDIRKRVYSEMPLCFSLLETRRPKGFQLWSGSVISGAKISRKDFVVKPHLFFLSTQDDIVACTTPGQFVEGEYSFGERLDKLQELSSDSFLRLSEEVGLLHGTIEKIYMSYGLLYEPSVCLDR